MQWLRPLGLWRAWSGFWPRAQGRAGYMAGRPRSCAPPPPPPTRPLQTHPPLLARCCPPAAGRGARASRGDKVAVNPSLVTDRQSEGRGRQQQADSAGSRGLHLLVGYRPLRAPPGGPHGRPQAHQIGALEVAMDDAAAVQVQHACGRGREAALTTQQPREARRREQGQDAPPQAAGCLQTAAIARRAVLPNTA